MEDTRDAAHIQVGDQLIELVLGELLQLRGNEIWSEVEEPVGEQMEEVGWGSEKGQQGLFWGEVDRLSVLKDQDLPRKTTHCLVIFILTLDEASEQCHSVTDR